MILSFAYTTDAFLADEKTATRRHWAERTLRMWQKAWDEERLEHDAWDKSPRYGGRKIGRLKLTHRPYLEALGDMPESDLAAEGGLWDSLEEFRGDDPPDTIVAVVRFVRIPEERQ